MIGFKLKRLLLVAMLYFAFETVQIAGKNTRAILSAPHGDSNEASMDTAVETSTKDYREDLTEIMNTLTRKVLPFATKFAGDPLLSSKCSAALLKLFLSLKRLEPWSLRMVTANGLLPNGMLEGGFSNVGSFDQCVNTRAVTRNDDKPDFVGQYCSLFLLPPRQMLERLVSRFNEIGELTGKKNFLVYPAEVRAYKVGYRLGLCIPSVCSEEDMDYVLNSILNEYGGKGSVQYCQQKHEPRLTGLQMGVLITFGVMISFVVLGTVFDLYCRRKSKSEKVNPSALGSVILSFSAVQNTEKLLDTRVPKGSFRERLAFVNGIKVLTALWVVLSHAYFCVQPDVIDSVFKSVDFIDQVHFQVLTSGLLSVSTFLFLSGFLLMHSMMEKEASLKKQNPFSVFVGSIFRRYLRITVPAAVVMLFFFLFPLFVFGPFAPDFVGRELQGCLTNWWTVLTHTNNFNRFENVCMLHYWYISTDIQLYVFALIVILITIRYPKLGFLLGGVLALVCTVGVGIQTYVKEYYPVILFSAMDADRTLETGEMVYKLPFSHALTYYLGLACAYCIHKHGSIKIRPIYQALFWIFAFALNISVIMIPLDWNRHGPPDKVTSAFFACLHKGAWSVSISWLVYACATGRGGLVNSFLSWRGFTIPGRLAYGVYLTHYLLYLARIGIINVHIQASEFLQLKDAAGVAFLSLFLSYALFLASESPVANIDKLMFERKRNTESNNSNVIFFPIENGKDAKPTNLESGLKCISQGIVKKDQKNQETIDNSSNECSMKSHL